MGPRFGMMIARLGTAILMAGMAGLCPASTVQAATPAETWARLKDGNRRFAEGRVVHPDQRAERRTETALGGQHPFACIVGCSDSRVPPELVFDQGIGSLFVVRVAGNVCDGDAIASVVYAVEHLKTPLLVILGHTACGAVTASVQKADAHDHLGELLKRIDPAIEEARRVHPKLKDDELIPFVIRNNVMQSIEVLFRGSVEIRSAVKEGELLVVGGVYDLETGEVAWLGTHPQQALLLRSGEGDRAAGSGREPPVRGHEAPAHGH